MAQLTISITLRAPLQIGAPHQGNTSETIGRIPGAVVRGAVAGVLMARWTRAERAVAHPDDCPDPNSCELCRVLYPHDGDGNPLTPPRFYDCYPAVAGSAVYPFPQTARTCKRYPGFLRQNAADERHGVHDTLIAQAAAQTAAKQPSPYVYSLECGCGEALKPPQPGHYGVSGDHFYTARPLDRRFSRTAINRRRHTALSGNLFTLTVMGEQMRTDLDDGGRTVLTQARTRLQGLVETGDADAARLREALAEVAWLGSSKSRGLGQVAVEALPARSAPTPDIEATAAALAQGALTAEPGDPNDMGARLLAFNATVAAERDFYRTLGVDVLPGAWYFSLDLLSNAFVHDGGLPTLALTAQMLGLAPARRVFMAADPVGGGGWSGAWGLPRPRQLGIGAGGAYLFRVDSAEVTLVTPLLERLVELEAKGIGNERERGAGRLLVCAPFHLEVEPR